MKTWHLWLTVVVIALTTAVAVGVFNGSGISGSGDYVVTPATPPGEDTVATDALAESYRDLPLWVQILSAVDTLLIMGWLAAFFPPVAGRIEHVLDNRNRHRIFNYVQKNPGCTPAEITMRQNMKNGTVKYHVQMLEAEGMIILKRMGKFSRLFRSSSGSSDLERVAATYVRNETSRGLLQAIMEHPGITNSSLSEQFQLDKSSVHWHIERFIRDRMIRFEQDGKYKRYFVSDEAKSILAKSMMVL
jgi:predicted transcriptional regulator